MRDEQLTRFGEQLISICRAHDIEPILYGSYLLRELIKEPIEVHDIDFYVSKVDFATIVDAFTTAGIEHRFDERWHTLQAFDGDLRVEFDSIDHWYDGPVELTNASIGREAVRALDRTSLEQVYERASKTSSTPERYREKLSLLRGDER